MMSFDSQLIHTCIIQRASETLDAYRNAVPGWRDVATIPCRLVEKQQRLMNAERVESLIVAAHTLLVGRDADIQERDRVRNITLEDGIPVSKTFVVKALLMRRGKALRHKSAVLEVVE